MTIGDGFMEWRDGFGARGGEKEKNEGGMMAAGRREDQGKKDVSTSSSFHF